MKVSYPRERGKAWRSSDRPSAPSPTRGRRPEVRPERSPLSLRGFIESTDPGYQRADDWVACPAPSFRLDAEVDGEAHVHQPAEHHERPHREKAEENERRRAPVRAGGGVMTTADGGGHHRASQHDEGAEHGDHE